MPTVNNPGTHQSRFPAVLLTVCAVLHSSYGSLVQSNGSSGTNTLDRSKLSFWDFWGRGLENLMGSATVTKRTESAIGCAALCSELDGCRHFCYNRAPFSCHAGGDLTSPNIVDFDDDVDCYATEANCPSSKGYDLVMGRCLKLEASYAQVAAKTVCEADGAHLHYIKTPIYDRPPLARILGNHGLTDAYVWTGADRLQKTEFRWDDGTLLPSDSGVWMFGEPNNRDGREECVMSYYGGLNDVPCNATLLTVCEKDF